MHSLMAVNKISNNVMILLNVTYDCWIGTENKFESLEKSRVNLKKLPK